MKDRDEEMGLSSENLKEIETVSENYKENKLESKNHGRIELNCKNCIESSWTWNVIEKGPEKSTWTPKTMEGLIWTWKIVGRSNWTFETNNKKTSTGTQKRVGIWGYRPGLRKNITRSTNTPKTMEHNVSSQNYEEIELNS